MVTDYVNRSPCCFLKKLFGIHQKKRIGCLCIYKQINIAIIFLLISRSRAKKRQRSNAILFFKYANILFEHCDTLVFLHTDILFSLQR